ncbi:carboxypeptidase-like regulatory domain-containing protein [Bacteroides sp.]
MRRHLIHFLLVAILTVCSAATAFAQTTVKGQVVDAETGEPLIGAAVTVAGTTQGSVTDLDGNFTQTVGHNETLVIKYLGYKEFQKRITQTGTVNLGVIKMAVDAVALSDVTITSSIAVARKTPVAVSTIDPVFIEDKLGNQEFPEILKSTPSVTASKVGGGYGDSEISLRGFASANVAVMINGVPMNDMEWGGIYWSNWQGLSDVTRSMQVQRGIGASKLSSPSVGGSINVLTNSLEAKRGGGVYYGMGNDGRNKISFNVSSGMTDKGWAFSILGSKDWGDGYIYGTPYESYSWFVNIAKRIGDNHSISLIATGAPQNHYKRYDRLTIAEWERQKKVGIGAGYRYNATYGFDDTGREYYGTNRNYYHKPQISLNHIWDINYKSSLSSTIYTSIGDGYGYRGVGSSSSLLYGSTNGLPNNTYRRDDGTFDYGALKQDNANAANGSLAAIAKNKNNHVWVGLLSTYNNKLTNNLDLQVGIDLRYYKGMHKEEISDLMGGAYVIDPDRKKVPYRKDDIAWQQQRLYIGDVAYRNFDSFIGQYGVFGQLEYSNDKLSAVVSANANVTTNQRYEHFYADNEKSGVVSKLGFGVKGGINYNITEHHNVFANIGYFSRTPYYSGGIFLNSQTSNALNPDSRNEKVLSYELGYGYVSSVLNVNLNLYRTAWNDRSIQKTLTSAQESPYLIMNGVGALHQGIELELLYKPIRGLFITGMFSIGDWTWSKNGVTGRVYDKNGQAMDYKNNIVAIGSPEQAVYKTNMKGIKVSNSEQTTAALGVNYELMKGLRLGVDGRFSGRQYADYDIASQAIAATEKNPVIDLVQPWRIPSAYTFDANISYSFKIGKVDAVWRANCNNLFNEAYITRALDNGAKTGGHDWNDATVFYGFGRTWMMSMRVKF